jgi:hypothetical protein
MTPLVESPWPALTLGVVLLVALAIALVRTGRVFVLVAMAAVLALTAGLLVWESLVVTEREAIEDTLYAAAAAVAANDAPAVVTHFTAESPARGEVEQALARFSVIEARVGGDLEIATNQLTNPPSARAFFTGRIRAHDNRREIPYENLIRKFRVVLHREDDRWLIHEVAVEDPISGDWHSARVRAR